MAYPQGTKLGSTPSGELDSKPDAAASSNPWIDLLRQEFKAPFLGLLKHYLDVTNGKKQKTLESCLSDFRAKYPKRFKLVFHIDALLHAIFLGLITIFVVRGLGMEHEIKSIADYLGRGLLYLKG